MKIKYVNQLLVLAILIVATPCYATTYLSKKEFIILASSDSDTQLVAKTLWLNEVLQKQIKQILDHKYPKLRLRYWQNSTSKDQQVKQTIWFLDEIGKERPISFGVSVVDNRVSLIKVLAFRESRGGEIRMHAFTDQFTDIGIDKNHQLDKHIDGISGATMSVTAINKITRIALMLHQLVSISKKL